MGGDTQKQSTPLLSWGREENSTAKGAAVLPFVFPGGGGSGVVQGFVGVSQNGPRPCSCPGFTLILA